MTATLASGAAWLYAVFAHEGAVNETGHIAGAVNLNWHSQLNDPVTRDYVDDAKPGTCPPESRHRAVHSVVLGWC